MEASRGPPRVKNKAPAPLQISAEQLLREAVDRQEPGLQAPTQRFADLEELHEFQGTLSSLSQGSEADLRQVANVASSKIMCAGTGST